MAEIIVPGPISGRNYGFRIKGDTPTVDEQQWIDNRISQKEQEFQQEYAAQFGAPVETGESEGFANYAGEVPKGLARGAVGLLETAGLGLATLLPEDYELPTREFIRRQAYNLSPQADIGLEDSAVGTVSEGLGSTIPLYGISMIPGIGLPLTAGLAAAAGAGEASERARAAGATQEQRNRAALFGVGVGVADLVPIFGSIKKRFGPQFTNRLVDYVVNIGMEGGEEAAQEAVTEVLQNMIEQGYNPDQDLGEGTLAAAGIGGLAGGIVAALLPGRTRPKPAEEERPLALPAPSATLALPAPETAATPAATPPTPGAVRGSATSNIPNLSPDAAATARSIGSDPQLLSAVEAIEAAGKATTKVIQDAMGVSYSAAKGLLKKLEGMGAVSKYTPGKERALTLPFKVSAVRQAQLAAAAQAPGVAAPAPTVTLPPSEAAAPAAPNAPKPLTEEDAGALARAVLDRAQAETRPAAPPATSFGHSNNAARVTRALNAIREFSKTNPAAAQVLRDNIDIVSVEVVGGTADPARNNQDRKDLDLVIGEGYAEGNLRDPELGEALSKLQSFINDNSTLQGLRDMQAMMGDKLPGTPSIDISAMVRTALAEPKAETRPAATEGAQDDAKAAAPESEAMGAGVEGGGRGVELGGQPAGDVQPAEGAPAPAKRGLGRGVSVPVDTDTAAGAEPDTLTGEPQPLRIDRVDAAALQGPDRPTRQLIPGTTIPVDPFTLQPTGAPRMESSDVYAPARVEPGIEPVAAGTVLTGAPSEIQMRDAEKQLAELRAFREQAENVAAQSELDAAWNARYADQPGLAALIDDFAVPDALVRDDPTTSTDKRKVLGLFERGGTRKDNKVDASAVNAKTYFSRFKRPVDAIEYIVADATLKNHKFKDEESLDAETGTLPDEGQDLSAEERVFFDGMSRQRAISALNWVYNNMSPQAAKVARQLRRKYKNINNAKAENKVIAPTTESAAVGAGRSTRAANAEERQAFEQELTQQAQEDTIKKQQAKALADAARTRRQGLNELLSAAQEAKAIPAKRRVIPTRLTPEAMLDFAVEKIMSIKRNRVADVDDLGIQLHPGAVRALRNNDLRSALRILAHTAPNKRINKLATALLPYADGIRVKMTADLRDTDGRKLTGQFTQNADGSNRQIELDADMGTDVETLLHEMVHAATVRALMVGTPMGRRIEKLFNELKPKLSHKYAAADAQEFVSYALTDPKFQSELSRLYTDGSRFSVLDRLAHEFMNFMRRLLGLQPRISGNALDVIDQMTMEIIRAPANLAEISNPVGARVLLNRVAQVDGSFPARTKEFAQQFGDDTSRVLSGASWGAKRSILGFMGMQPLTDVAAHFNISGARDLMDAINQHDAAAIASDGEVDAVLQVGEGWANKNPSLKPMLASVIDISTTEQVDPELTREQAKKKYGKDSDKLRIYDEMQPDWVRLGKDGRAVYTNMRELYRKQYTRLREALAGKIDFVLSSNPELAADVKASIYTKFFDMNQIEPYFPLARSGDFWLEYSAFNPKTNTTEPVKETFDSPRARDRAAAELANIPGIAKDASGKPITNFYTTMDLVTRGRTPDSLLVRDILTMVRSNLTQQNVDQATMDSIQQEITRMFVQALPETSFAKSLQKRKNTKGYITDPFEAMRIKGYALGRQGVRYKYSNKIRAIVDGITGQAKGIGDANKVAVIEELQARAEFALNPPDNMFERASQLLNRTAFTFTLGFNVSSSIVNLSSIPVVVYPYLAGRYGGRATTVALGDAYKLFLNSGLSREIELPSEFQGKRTAKTFSMPSMDNYFVLREKRGVDAAGKQVISHEYVLRDDTPPQLRKQLADLGPLVDVASKNGQLNRSVFYDSLGVENVGRARTFWDRFTALSGGMFHQVERANRQVTLIAAYKLELDRLRTKPNQEERSLTDAERQTRAAERAVYQATETGGGATLAAAPRWAQRNIGRVALMFKNYGLSMAYLQMKLLKQLTIGSNDPNFTPEDRRVAFRQLVGLNLSTFALAGVAGMPIYGLASTVANMFLGDDEEDADMLTRRYLGEGYYKGFLTEISGLDVSSRIGLTDLLIRENRYNTDPSAEETLVANLGGPAWSTATRVGRGVSEFFSAMTGGEGDMVRGIENMLPVAFSNMVKTGRVIAEGGDLETRRKDVITGDLGGSELLGQVLGFRPSRASLQQDINQLKVRISKNISQKRSDLAKAYYIALRVGDIEGAKDALQAIRDFNAGIRDQYPGAIIDGEFLEDSLRSHQRTSAQTQAGVYINPAVRAGLDELTAQYNQGLQIF